MKQCSNCGASLDNDALFCTECGTRFEIQTSQICPSCGAILDADSMFCRECGMKTHIEITPIQNPKPTPQFSNLHQVSDEQICEKNFTPNANSTEQQTDDGTKSKTPLIVIITILVILLCGVGGYFYYDNVYLPDKIDREAPRYYTMANAVVLRSSKSAGADYNKIGTLPYGTELITYEHDNEWSKVKVNSINADKDKPEGYVASPFLLNKHDFFLLNSVFGNQESKENIITTKCRIAVLNYFKDNGYIGKIDTQIRTEVGIDIVPRADNQWQIFCRPVDVKPNNVLFKRLYDRNSQFTDFAVIIQNITTNQRKLLYFYFDEDETPHLLTEQDAPIEGFLKNINMTNYGEIKAVYSY